MFKRFWGTLHNYFFGDTSYPPIPSARIVIGDTINVHGENGKSRSFTVIALGGGSMTIA